MSRRTDEGHMDWEYHSIGPVDPTSPWTAHIKQQQQKGHTNPFAPSSSFSSAMQPPKTSVFSPQVQSRYPTASAFRNPAFNSAPPPSFTTPRKPFDEVVMSEASGAESSPATTTGIASPALTDTSEAAPQQHEIDTIRAVSPARRQHQQSGKGAIPRRNHLSLFGRAAGKVRKRARYDDDRDVGSVRHRIESRYRGDETDDDTDAVPGEAAGRRRRSRTSEGGWLRHIFGLIHDHPRLPEILTWWLQFALNAFIMALVVYVCWAFVSSVRADLQLASELERAELAQKIADCGQNYVVNHCASDRAAPALEEQCREWARCMSEDPNKVMKVQNAAKEAVRVINQIGDNVSWRTLIVFLSSIAVAFLANNIGFGMVRSHQAAEYVRMNQQQPTHSQPASLSSSQATLPGTASQNGPLAPPHLFSPPPSLHHNPNQAYIWAPIPTPSRRRDGTIRRPRLPAHISEYFSGDGQNSDTDDGAVADASVLTEDASSPELPKAIMAPPETPSRRTASPTRVDMNGSPTRRRSPGKAW